MNIDKNKLILSISILIASLILGGAYFLVQINKQNSIERQAQLKIDQENKIREKEEQEKAWDKLGLSGCLVDAEDEFWSYMELNGTGKRDVTPGVRAPQWIWDIAKEDKKEAIDLCYKRYKD